MNELDEIKMIRKKLGITQAELSKKAGVSQSLIAKIESGRVEPNYSSVKRIFEVLATMSKDDQLVASQIMVKRIIECRKEEPLAEVIQKMRRFNISQLPVFSGTSPIGMVSESVILDKLSTTNGGISALKVADVMGDCPPIVNAKTTSEVILNLLRHFSMVLVSDDGKIVGVITKADILNAASRGI